MNMIMTKKGEIKSFTDQVRIICVKNDIDKPNLGKKIGMDCDFVFTAIKNNAFKPDPETYFRLEAYICKKNSHYKNKLRSKYEKTLDISEWDDYMHATTDAIKPPKKKMEKMEKMEKTMTIVIDKPKAASKIDSESRVKFYQKLKASLPEGLSITKVNEQMGHKWVENLRTARSFVPVDELPRLFDMCGIEEGSDIYNELVELELSCIAGSKENAELAKYEVIFGQKNEKEEVKEMEMVKEEAKEVIPDNSALKHEFSAILTKWLFVKGYTLKQAARAIGCSETEFKNMINGDICLSPYHVNRFKDTIGMDVDTIDRLVKIANVCYEGHEIPKSVLNYISSDITIINTLEEIVRQNKGATFWDNMWKEL